MSNIFLTFQVIALIVIVAEAQLSLSSVPCRSISDIFRNDLPVARIVGGTNAARGSIPYIASLTRRGGHFCGATIINEEWLLTAAHCVCTGFGEIMPPHRMRAVLGLYARSEFNNQASNTIHDNAYEIEFENFVIHPNYSCNRPENDIALLKTNLPIRFSKTVQPICISSSSSQQHKTYVNEVALISGWGNLDEKYITDRPDVLQNAKVHVWSNRECQSSYERQSKTQTIWPTQMCAGRKLGGVDACWADSGGPMVSNDDGLIGIVSTGIGCARPGLPGIYTRVSEYTQWIKQIVQAENRT